MSCRNHLAALIIAGIFLAGCQKQTLAPTSKNAAETASVAKVSLSNGTTVAGLRLARRNFSFFNRTAPTILYVNFTGATTDGAPWGLQGETITLTSARLSPDVQRALTAEVSEDFWFLNTTVTADKKVYERATGIKVECIIARKDASGQLPLTLENFGGLAIIGSITLETQIPCVAFVDQYDALDDSTKIKRIAWLISHEIGHAYGLNHNGEYFDGQFFTDYKVPSGDFRYGDIMGNASQSYLSRFCDGQSVELDGAVQHCGELMAATSGYREGINSLQPLILPLGFASRINTGLIHSTDRQALLKIDPREQTITITSNGDLEPWVAVYPGLTKTGSPTIYHELSDAIIIRKLSGVHLIEVYTEQPDPLEFPNPASGGGSYQIQVSTN